MGKYRTLDENLWGLKGYKVTKEKDVSNRVNFSSLDPGPTEAALCKYRHHVTERGAGHAQWGGSTQCPPDGADQQAAGFRW